MWGYWDCTANWLINNHCQWLENYFLKYLDDWEASVERRSGFSAAQKLKMQISQETLLGIRITSEFSGTHEHLKNYCFMWFLQLCHLLHWWNTSSRPYLEWSFFSVRKSLGIQLKNFLGANTKEVPLMKTQQYSNMMCVCNVHLWYV